MGFQSKHVAGKLEALRWVCSRHCGLAHIYTIARYHFRNCTFLRLPLDRNKHSGAPGTRANEWSRRRTAFPGFGNDCDRQVLVRDGANRELGDSNQWCNSSFYIHVGSHWLHIITVCDYEFSYLQPVFDIYF